MARIDICSTEYARSLTNLVGIIIQSCRNHSKTSLKWRLRVALPTRHETTSGPDHSSLPGLHLRGGIWGSATPRNPSRPGRATVHLAAPGGGMRERMQRKHDNGPMACTQLGLGRVPCHLKSPLRFRPDHSWLSAAKRDEMAVAVGGPFRHFLRGAGFPSLRGFSAQIRSGFRTVQCRLPQVRQMEFGMPPAAHCRLHSKRA
jgi:hypothetical protein